MKTFVATLLIGVSLLATASNGVNIDAAATVDAWSGPPMVRDYFDEMWAQTDETDDVELAQ